MKCVQTYTVYYVVINRSYTIFFFTVSTNSFNASTETVVNPSLPKPMLLKTTVLDDMEQQSSTIEPNVALTLKPNSKKRRIFENIPITLKKVKGNFYKFILLIYLILLINIYTIYIFYSTGELIKLCNFF